MIFAETQEKIFGEILNDVINSTNLTRSSPGSKTRALIEAVSKKMGKMYSVFDLNFSQAFLSGAEGKWLSYIGDMMNVPQLGETSAKVTALDKNVKFTLDVGTFGDINSGANITIPAGEIISSEAGGQGIQYKTVVSTILDKDADEGYVSVESIQTGSGQNVGKGQLRYHLFNSYTDYVNSTLLVTNESDIVTGSDIESISNYRYRVANQVTASQNANEIAVRLAALAVPGVADVTMLPYHRGIGSFDLLVKSTTPTVSDSLLAAVQVSVSQVESNGILSTVRKPKELGISLVGTLEYKRLLSTAEESEILTAAVQNVSDRINSLDISEEFIVQNILEAILATSALIKKVGSTDKPFDNIYIHKPSRLEDNKVRNTLIDDYDPDSDERIIVENKYAGASPILLRSA